MKPLCIVSGGTSGIGFEIAKSLAPRFRLALIYKSNHDRAKESLKALNAIAANNHAVFDGDLGTAEGTEEIVRRIEAWDGQVPLVLINNAGQSALSFFVKDSLSDQLHLIQANLLSCVNLSHFILKKMYAQKAGHIINVSSIAVEAKYLGSTIYATAKAGIEAFTKNLSLEVYHKGIRVNCVRPGLIRTPATERLVDHVDGLKSVVSISAVVAAVEYLLDPRAESVSGAVINASRA